MSDGKSTRSSSNKWRKKFESDEDAFEVDVIDAGNLTDQTNSGGKDGDSSKEENKHAIRCL